MDFSDFLGDDFVQDDFKDADSYEDSFDDDMESAEQFDDDSDLDGESDNAESKDDFTAKDAFFLGGAMGFGYEEGLRERKRRKRKSFSDDSD